MQMSALIAVRLAELATGLNARQRWQATQNLQSDGSFMTSRWFTIAMVIVLATSIIAFLVVSLVRKVKELKSADRIFSSTAARKGLTAAQSDLLMAIAVSAGLKKSEDIFSASEAFERGAEKLLVQSRAGKLTNETSRLERQLAGLREKLRFRKVSPVSTTGTPEPSEKTPAVKPADTFKANPALVAIFPFERKFSPASTRSAEASFSANGKQEQLQQGSSSSQSGKGAEWSRRLPEFLPAIVSGTAGQVVFVETMLAANVGDRILIVIGPQGAGNEPDEQELFEETGFVQQSIQPAELIKEPNARRLGIGLTGLNEAQMARLAGAIAAPKTTAKTKLDNVASEEATSQKPVGSQEQTK